MSEAVPPYQCLPPEQNPYRVLFTEVTHRCNMACSNCYLPNRTIPDMDGEKLNTFLSKLPFRTEVRLIGGEVSLHLELQ